MSDPFPLKPIAALSIEIKDGTHGTHQRVEQGVPLLSAKNIEENGTLRCDETDEQVSESEYKIITAGFTPRNNDLLLTVVGTLGRRALFYGERVCFQRSVAFIRPNQEIVRPRYLFHAMADQPFQKQLFRRCNITAQAGLYLGELGQVVVPVPPFTEQDKVCSILDSFDSTIEKTEALIAKYQLIKAGLMQSFFMSPDATARWTPMTLNDLFENIIDYRGKTPAKTVSGIPLITAKNVRVGYIDPEPREFIAESDYSTWMTRGIPRKGDILFTTEAPLGNVAEIPTKEKLAFAQRVIILQSKSIYIPSFVKHLLMSPLVQDSFQRNASGSTALGIKQSTFRRVTILATEDRDEQQAIADKLDSIDAFLRIELLSLEKLKKIKIGLMVELFSGAGA